MTGSCSRARLGLRTTTVLLPFAAALVLAGPASAVPEGWSDPDPVTGMQVLAVFVLGPLAVTAATVLLTLLPRWAGAAKAAPALAEPAPRTALDELLSAETPREVEAPGAD